MFIHTGQGAIGMKIPPRQVLFLDDAGRDARNCG